jgi:hypothetical protein
MTTLRTSREGDDVPLCERAVAVVHAHRGRSAQDDQ